MKRNKRAKVGVIRRLLVVGSIVGMVGFGSAALAQSDAGAPVVVELKAPAAEPAEAAEAPEVGSNEDLVLKLKEAKARYDALKDAKEDGEHPVKYMWAFLIAAMANLILSGVKRTMKLTGKAKKILPWVAVSLSGVVTGALHFAGGMSLSSAIFFGGAVVGSIVLQELGVIPIKSSDSNAKA
jgi:hypothetical protein